MGDTLVGPGQPVAADVRGDLPDWWDKVVEQGFVYVQDTLRKEARKLGFRLWRWKGAMGKLADDAEEQVAPPHHVVFTKISSTKIRVMPDSPTWRDQEPKTMTARLQEDETTVFFWFSLSASNHSL